MAGRPGGRSAGGDVGATLWVTPRREWLTWPLCCALCQLQDQFLFLFMFFGVGVEVFLFLIPPPPIVYVSRVRASKR